MTASPWARSERCDVMATHRPVKARYDALNVGPECFVWSNEMDRGHVAQIFKHERKRGTKEGRPSFWVAERMSRESQRLVSARDGPPRPDTAYLLSRYITNPLLLERRKFEVRLAFDRVVTSEIQTPNMLANLV
jgi:hypothetical protein